MWKESEKIIFILELKFQRWTILSIPLKSALVISAGNREILKSVKNFRAQRCKCLPLLKTLLEGFCVCVCGYFFSVIVGLVLHFVYMWELFLIDVVQNFLTSPNEETQQNGQMPLAVKLVCFTSKLLSFFLKDSEGTYISLVAPLEPGHSFAKKRSLFR